jgi:hypothetical protein
MTVQSARVNELVVGDDVVLTHQIMGDVAYNAELTRAPITLNSPDVVFFFYALASGVDLIGYQGSPVGSLPSSICTVSIPGTIAPSGDIPARGSSTFLPGPGPTVRAEIYRNYGLSNQARETYYLYDEVDVYPRGFPLSPLTTQLNLT